MTTLNAQKITGTEQKATKANVKTAKLQTEKANALLEKVNEKAPVFSESKAPAKITPPDDNYNNIVNHTKSTDFVRSAFIAATNEVITSGKNALIFKAYLENKKNVKVELLIELGYKFSDKVDLSSCTQSQLANKVKKFKTALEKNYLHNIAMLFSSFIKTPTEKKLNSITEFNSLNSGVIKSVLRADIKEIIFSDALTFAEKMNELPSFLTVNYAEKITPELSEKTDESSEPLELSSPTIATDNFNAIRDFILNDADNATLELMQALIAQKLQPTE